jgi:NRAMP (natural resistance-associated macrophage protein)-like metal ion transporter
MRTHPRELKENQPQLPPRLDEGSPAPPAPSGRGWRAYLKGLGPGVMAGLADNDPAGVASYAIAGATAGFGQLWLLVLATFMVQAVQVSAARLGDVTHHGIVSLTEQHYGRAFAGLVVFIGVVANEATLIADTAAIGAALQLLTGLDWRWFVLPAIFVLMFATVFFSFARIRTFFMVVGLLLLSYVVTAFLAHPNWEAALHAMVIPRLPSGLGALEAAVALLGTTVSPYLLFWEAEGEKEEHRGRKQFRIAAFDVTVGYVVSNLVSYFIIVTTAATLFVHHQQIQTAADAANALRPLLGDKATLIFGLGLLATGLLAVPMFAISSGFIVGEFFRWRCDLSLPFSEARAFYSVLIAAFLSGALAVLLGVNPIIALFDSQILDDLLMPVLIVIVFLLVNNRRAMGTARNPIYYNVWLVVSFLVMIVAAVAMVLQFV